jgi:hypothetical protein
MSRKVIRLQKIRTRIRMTTRMMKMTRKRVPKTAKRKGQKMVWVKKDCRLDNGVTRLCHLELVTVSRKGMRTAEIYNTSFQIGRARADAEL